MLLSCPVTRGIWRFQRICDDTEHTACSMTLPYRQGVNSYLVHCRSLLQSSRTLSKIDIIYSLLKCFIYTSRYSANNMSTRQLLVLVTIWDSLSDLMERSSKEYLKLLQDCHFLGIVGYNVRSLGVLRWLWCVAPAVGRVWLCLHCLSRETKEEFEDS